MGKRQEKAHKRRGKKPHQNNIVEGREELPALVRLKETLRIFCKEIRKHNIGQERKHINNKPQRIRYVHYRRAPEKHITNGNNIADEQNICEISESKILVFIFRAVDRYQNAQGHIEDKSGQGKRKI